MICECTIKENSFVSPYDVMVVLQYSLITSFVSIVLPQIISSCLFLAYTSLRQIVKEKGYSFDIKTARKLYKIWTQKSGLMATN